MSNAEAMLKQVPRKQLEPELEPELELQNDSTSFRHSSVTANVNHYAARAFHVSDEQLAVDAENSRKALRIAIEGAEQIDELSLLGYPTSLDPATKAVVETVLFYVARNVIES